ncbi:MAG TPA: hypothetical protein P5552_17050 [Candidatus Competibacteraceae bacterium]|nr:hypothetical protein [Candidatus Competibacteraceae bacterium]
MLTTAPQRFDIADGAAEVVAAPFLADHVFVDAAGGEVVTAGRGHAEKGVGS